MSAASSSNERPKWVAPFFHSADQQLSAANFGMWLFIAQEILFFAGLFMAYIVYRWMYPETWLSAAEVLDKTMGAANTVVLLTSSLTMVFAVRELEMNRIKSSIRYLWITIGCACIFLVVKNFEYTHKIEMGIFHCGHYSTDAVE
jgi:cytochrome c oxidase subunit 3